MATLVDKVEGGFPLPEQMIQLLSDEDNFKVLNYLLSLVKSKVFQKKAEYFENSIATLTKRIQDLERKLKTCNCGINSENSHSHSKHSQQKSTKYQPEEVLHKTEIFSSKEFTKFKKIKEKELKENNNNNKENKETKEVKETNEKDKENKDLKENSTQQQGPTPKSPPHSQNQNQNHGIYASDDLKVISLEEKLIPVETLQKPQSIHQTFLQFPKLKLSNFNHHNNHNNANHNNNNNNNNSHTESKLNKVHPFRGYRFSSDYMKDITTWKGVPIIVSNKRVIEGIPGDFVHRSPPKFAKILDSNKEFFNCISIWKNRDIVCGGTNGFIVMQNIDQRTSEQILYIEDDQSTILDLVEWENIGIIVSCASGKVYLLKENDLSFELFYSNSSPIEKMIFIGQFNVLCCSDREGSVFLLNTARERFRDFTPNDPSQHNNININITNNNTNNHDNTHNNNNEVPSSSSSSSSSPSSPRHKNEEDSSLNGGNNNFTTSIDNIVVNNNNNEKGNNQQSEGELEDKEKEGGEEEDNELHEKKGSALLPLPGDEIELQQITSFSTPSLPEPSSSSPPPPPPPSSSPFDQSNNINNNNANGSPTSNIGISNLISTTNQNLCRSICHKRDDKNSLFYSDGNEIVEVNLINKGKIKKYEGHLGAITALTNYQFDETSSKHLLVSGSEDLTIRFWDTESTKCLYIIRNAHHAPIRRLFEFPEQSYSLISSSSDVDTMEGSTRTKIWIPNRLAHTNNNQMIVLSKCIARMDSKLTPNYYFRHGKMEFSWVHEQVEGVDGEIDDNIAEVVGNYIYLTDKVLIVCAKEANSIIDTHNVRLLIPIKQIIQVISRDCENSNSNYLTLKIKQGFLGYEVDLLLFVLNQRNFILKR